MSCSKKKRRSVMFPVLTASLILIATGMAGAQDIPGKNQAGDRSSAWMSDVVRQVEQSEYSVSWQHTSSIPGLNAGYSAPNRAQNLRFAFSEDGIQATSRVDPTWVLGLHPSSISVGERSVSITGQTPTTSDNEVVYYHGGSIQTLVNRPGGLDYSLRIDGPPGPGDSMKVAFELSGDLGLRSRGTDTVELRHAGESVLRFGPLLATDTLGATLPVVLGRGANGEVEVGIDVRDAVFPVKVEGALKSISASPDFFMNDNIAYSRLGFSVATAGDVNGDGYSDVIVGFPGFDGAPGIESGKVQVYHGGPNGPGTPASANWTVLGTKMRSKFGFSVATAGDVNNDGYSDVIIGAPYHDVNGTDTREGGVWVYHGSSNGLNSNYAWHKLADQADAHRGTCVATAGDVNGDGFSDIIFSEDGYDHVQSNRGRVWIYLGASSGLTGSSSFYPMGDQADAYFGHSVATAGDVNGDGYADVVISAPWYDHSGFTSAGEVRVYLGSSSGPNPLVYTSITQTGSHRQLGYQVSTAGDVDGDGYADLLVGSSKSEYGEGAAYLYTGGSTGIGTNVIWSAEGVSAGSWLGKAVATAGDVNGDGYADVIIGASGMGSSGRGEAYIWLGGSEGLGADGTPANADWTGEADPTSGISYGFSVATAGDVNGDGYSDTLVGDPDLGADNDGGVYGYYGGPNYLADGYSWWDLSFQETAQTGASVATAGDVNGDGYSDFIVGAEFYDYGPNNEGAVFVWYGDDAGPGWAGADWAVYGGMVDARLGHSVGTAGDVNGDGYSDIIVGAPGWANGNNGEGAAFVFHGSASGLIGTTTATAAWKAEINSSYAQLGWSVGTAGDVNDDGYADVVIGAPGAGAGSQGKVFLWRGSASGLGANGTAANADWDWIGSTAGGSFGQSVGTAGDVNRDSYSDLIVGGDEVAVVWHGSATGLSSTTFDWSYASSGLEDNDLGYSVGTAGDTGGDGYSDVVVGAPLMDSDMFTTDDGAVLVFCGGSSGLGAGPCFTDYGGADDTWLGSSVGTAGDLNGDGLSDVVAGARHWSNDSHWEGQARVYYGTIFGLWAADWTYESDNANAYLGTAVGTAGDINGDGYADLLLGAPGYTNLYAAEGMAFLFYGNGEGGRTRFSQQLSPGGQPVAPQGVSTSENTIHFYHQLATPSTGRGKVRMLSEVKVASTNFQGNNMQYTNAVNTGTTGANVGQDWTGLTLGTRHHWRSRVMYSPVTNPFEPPRGPWFHISTFGENEAHFRTAGNSNPQQPLIFSDGFESGNFSGWSSVNQ